MVRLLRGPIAFFCGPWFGLEGAQRFVSPPFIAFPLSFANLSCPFEDTHFRAQCRRTSST